MNSRNIARAALAFVAAVCLSGLAAAESSDAGAAAGKKVNINQASAKELANLPRIGEKVAERIVEYRQAHGPFTRVEDLMEVKGIGEKLFTTLKPYVTLSGPTTLTEKVSSRGTRGGAPGARASSKSASKSASNAVRVGK